jgi:hypothetical protein
MMENKLASNNIQIKSEWVKGHQDENMEWNSIDELKNLKLSNTATLNVWCNHQAEAAWIQGWTDPEANVCPSEKWAVFTETPVSQKITGPLNYNIIYTLSHAALETYINQKHGICESKLNEINTCGIHSLMKTSKPQKRATIAKIIHCWIPTNDFLHQQDRTKSAECTRCKSCRESADHILDCSDIHVIESRDKHLYHAFNELEALSTNTNILHIFEQQLCKLLHVPIRQKYQYTEPTPTINKILLTALHNQKISGWHEFLRGFISKYWITTQDRTQLTPNKKQPPWKLKITSIILVLHNNIRDDRNTFVHGITINEA